MTDSNVLLTQYSKTGRESAFRELVNRYVDLVYSTALRQVGGDAHLAQDVTQTVFLHLARKARQIAPKVMLGGWLHQATCNVAATVMRTERRRHLREREAAEMKTLHDDPPCSLHQIGPILDEAIGELPDEDRAAVLLRFFEKRDFRSVGEALGTSEDAARMRVNRALEKLQVLLKQRGVTASAAVLGTALAVEAVTAAPVGLAASITTTALTGVSAGGLTTFVKFMAMSKLKISTISVVVVAALTTALVVQQRSVAQLREDNRSLQQQVQALSDTKAQAPGAPVDTNELATLRRNESELLRLRAQVTALRNAQKTPLPSASGANNTPTAGAADPPAVTQLHASVRTQVISGRTLLTGGWINETGGRIFVMATPLIQGDNADQVGIKTRVFEIPPEALASTGLEAFRAEGMESSLQQVFEPDQVNLLMKQLKETQGARLITEANLLTLDGRQATIQSTPSPENKGEEGSLSPTIEIVPVISNDKTAIDLSLSAGLNKPSGKP